MKKLTLICLTVFMMGLGGCSSTDELAKADSTETNKKQSKRSKGECQKSTGSRLARNDC